jgi:hypothetical protein
MATLGMALPTTAIAADPSGHGAGPDIQDVTLRPDGMLRGQLVRAEGGQSVNTLVRFHRDGRMVAETVTDANGQFVVHSLTGGVYAVQTPANVGHYRVWTNQAAPPSAAHDLRMVEDEIIRGQCEVPSECGVGPGYGHARGYGLLKKPWLFGLGVAAAIAIPLAVDNDDRGPAS